ncbi:MAG: hypothetical protein ACM3MK_06780 [Chitinophagales bacterium]
MISQNETLNSEDIIQALVASIRRYTGSIELDASGLTEVIDELMERWGGTIEFNQILHSKMLVARVLYENGYDEKKKIHRVSYRNCFNLLLSREEKESTLARWFYMFGEGADWEEHLYPLIEEALSLPRCPQKFRDDNLTPLEKKMLDSAFCEYYTKLSEIIDELMEKYKPLYESTVRYWIKQGSYGVSKADHS